MVSNPWGLNTHEYVGEVEGFDRLAPRYDELVESNPLHAHMRAQSIAWLDRVLHPGMSVLDIGCGVGTEAIHVAGRSINVVASDVSQAMVEVAQERVLAAGLANRVRILRSAASGLPAALPRAGFDAAYASFGALNCELDIVAAIGGIADLLRPNAPLLLSVASRPCLNELLFGAAGFRFRKAFRRLHDQSLVDLYGLGRVRFRTYSDSELRRALDPWFRVDNVEGWLVVLPPPYLAQGWVRLRPLHRPMESLDRWAARTWPFRGWGDHLHILARRRTP